jgi:hypothetical protein
MWLWMSHVDVDLEKNPYNEIIDVTGIEEEEDYDVPESTPHIEKTNGSNNKYLWAGVIVLVLVAVVTGAVVGPKSNNSPKQQQDLLLMCTPARPLQH